MQQRSYSDAALAEAVAGAHSWRGVLRALGLRATSAGSARSVRRHADRLGLSYNHFTGQRRWTDTDLVHAVASARTWPQVAATLGLVPEGGTLTSLRAHAHRLALDTHHLNRRPAPDGNDPLRDAGYRQRFLRDAGSLFAATWFTLRGAKVAWPLEPCRYDLLADLSGRLYRIQVKTTSGCGPRAVVQVSNTRRTGRTVYAPGEIDSFFVLDADLTAYLIPYCDVAGYGELQLGRYANFVIVDRGRLIPGSASACASPGP